MKPLEFIEIREPFVRNKATDAEGTAPRRGHPNRSLARFNRIDEDTLYISPDAENASVAIGGDVVEQRNNSCARPTPGSML